MRYFERMKELREAKKLTKICVEKAINSNFKAYSRYESGEQAPGLDKLILLADFYNISLDYLVGRSENPERN